MNMEKSSTTLTPLAVKNGRKAVRKAKKFSDSSSSPSRRKSLQLLRPVAGDQSQLIGSDGVIRLTNQTSKTPKRKLASDGKCQPKKVFRPDVGKNFTIFEDTSKSSSSSSQTRPSAEQEAIDMMTQAEPTEKYWEELAEERKVALEEIRLEKYWEELAEERKVALEETLKENEQLFTENRELKEENDKLKVIAGQAEYLADVVETLMTKLESSGCREDVSDEEDETKENDEESDHEDDEEEDEVFVKDDSIGEDDTLGVQELDGEGKEDEV
uniref:Geminin n=1 Tax=Psammechinus miliaris TaxID=7660 RepID=H8Y6Q2_PSAMI|nr:Geminin [Psammechinus miliaris]